MNDCGISKLDLKRRNRMHVLRVIREKGPISRVDLSKELQITRAAVTIIANEMIDQHILEELGEEPLDPTRNPRKGRRKILLDINDTYKFAVGIYVDEKEISIGLTTLSSAALDKQNISLKKRPTVDSVMRHVTKTLDKMLQNSCLEPDRLLGIGVGIMPSVFHALGAKEDCTGKLIFPELQRRLEKTYQMPIYIDNAVVEFAMAGTHCGESHVPPESQVFLYMDSDHYCAIPLYGNAVRSGADVSGRFIEKFSLDCYGKELEGHPRGSVQAEISIEAMIQKIQPVFSQADTPVLYQSLNGNLSQLTMAKLLTAADYDVPLMPIASTLLEKFVMLLYNLYCVYQTKSICLYRFGFQKAHLTWIRSCAERFGGEEFAESIQVSPIGERFQFICGCNYVIQVGFFQLGGLTFKSGSSRKTDADGVEKEPESEAAEEME